MTETTTTTSIPRYAAFCAPLRLTFGATPGEGPINLCRHIIRDGMPCVGPFLDDHETDCGFWEPKPGAKPPQGR